MNALSLDLLPNGVLIIFYKKTVYIKVYKDYLFKYLNPKYLFKIDNIKKSASTHSILFQDFK